MGEIALGTVVRLYLDSIKFVTGRIIRMKLGYVDGSKINKIITDVELQLTKDEMKIYHIEYGMRIFRISDEEEKQFLRQFKI